jgi:hypothetical protein
MTGGVDKRLQFVLRELCKALRLLGCLLRLHEFPLQRFNPALRFSKTYVRRSRFGRIKRHDDWSVCF